MIDDWEDWEDWEDFTVPILNEMDIKKINDQKAIEESDNKLTEDLFNISEVVAENTLTMVDKSAKTPPQNNKIKITSKRKILNNVNNRENQIKIAVLNKEIKAKEKKMRDVFGDSDIIDEYDYIAENMTR